MLLRLPNAMFKFIKHFSRPKIPSDLPLCQLPSPLDLSAARRVLVFSPHPDDETLGCGGTLALLAPHCEVRVVLVTDGGGGGALPPEIGEMRRTEWLDSMDSLGVSNVGFMNAPDGGVFPSKHWQQMIDDEVNDFQPNWVISPSMLDYHRDHMSIAQMVYLSCQKQFCVQQILTYEIWSPIWATHVVDITDVISVKREALLLQKTSMQYGNYLQAVEGLNFYRGLYLGRTGAAAEAFSVLSSNRTGWRMACHRLWLKWLVHTAS